MTTAVAAYDDLVNGHGMRTAQLLLGRMPLPQLGLSSQAQPSGVPRILQLEPYDAADPDLRVDSAALAPIAHVLVHGSIATGDACGFSDVDVAVIPDDLHTYTPEQHARAMEALRHLLTTIFSYDPLMHHGLMFFPASGFLRYDQRFLPIEALRLARVVHGPSELLLWETPGPPGAFADAFRACTVSLAKRLATTAFAHNDYALKHAVSAALLMPSRMLAAHDIHVYKRDSFELARSYFSTASWEFIARCEALRFAWERPDPPVFERTILAKMHPHLQQVTHQRLAPRDNARRLSRRMIDGLQRSAAQFAHYVETAAP
jgi:hypothetical protein